MPRLILFVNGLVLDMDALRRMIQPGDVFYAVDGGTRHVRALGLIPSLVLGDLDSLTAQDREWLKGQAVQLVQHPRDKDQTDLELALDLALQAGFQQIRIAGAFGGRLDQTLANLTLLSNLRFSDLDIRLDDGAEEAFFTRSHALIHGKPGNIVSLLPWAGDAAGVETERLRWPLHGETLFSSRTRGISNEMLDETAIVSLKSGCLLIIHQRGCSYGKESL